MTIHALKEYIRYKWNAKKLHGVHSPFAYEFSEKVLYENGIPAHGRDLSIAKWLRPHFFKVLARLVAFYNYQTVFCLDKENEEDAGTYDVLLLKDNEPGNWVRLFNKHYPHLKPNCAIMVSGIHKTERHTAKWQRLYKHPRVMMSIDLYGVGVLFFRKEFKEKQHFVLKY